MVGKNYAYQTMGSVNVFFEDKIMNPFIGAGALASVVDEFNGDNFDHSGLGFIGGGYIAQMQTGGRPIEMIYTPDRHAEVGPASGRRRRRRTTCARSTSAATAR